MNSFGVAIPVTGPNNGFPGSVTRMGDRAIKSRVVSILASALGIPFGSGVVQLSDSTGGKYLSFADQLATVANVATLQQLFAGIAVRNVQTNYQYTSLYASFGTTVITATATQVITGSTTVVVASASGTITIGMAAEGAGIAIGAVVTGVSGTTITLSLPTTAAIPALTPVTFTQTVTQGVTGFYVANQQCDALLNGSILVTINNGTPQSNLPVYVRGLANANLPGTSIGDFEAADDVATSTPTTSTTVGSATLTVSTGTGVAIGQRVTAPGIPSNTYIIAGAGTSWTLSQLATATTVTAAASFSNMILLGDAVNPWLRFSTGVLDVNNAAEITVLVRHAA